MKFAKQKNVIAQKLCWFPIRRDPSAIFYFHFQILNRYFGANKELIKENI